MPIQLIQITREKLQANPHNFPAAVVNSIFQHQNAQITLIDASELGDNLGELEFSYSSNGKRQQIISIDTYHLTIYYRCRGMSSEQGLEYCTRFIAHNNLCKVSVDSHLPITPQSIDKFQKTFLPMLENLLSTKHQTDLNSKNTTITIIYGSGPIQDPVNRKYKIIGKEVSTLVRNRYPNARLLTCCTDPYQTYLFNLENGSISPRLSNINIYRLWDLYPESKRLDYSPSDDQGSMRYYKNK